MARLRDSGAYVIWITTLAYGLSIGDTSKIPEDTLGALIGAILILTGVGLVRSNKKTLGTTTAITGIAFYIPIIMTPNGIPVILASATLLALASRGPVETIVYGSQLLALPGALLASQHTLANGLLALTYAVSATSHLGVWVTQCQWCRTTTRAYLIATALLAYIAIGKIGMAITLLDWLILREALDKPLKKLDPKPRTHGLIETLRMTLYFTLLIIATG